ncbi:MAG: 4Fe-4S dicluster domain-containing protein [Methanomethylovorans sp.]|uniref:4Fe-4S dicluster domain-containing protein n=1 Tax=Methanomethylovorans sp. TaxID=2758717 RepID=UPI0035315E4C
MTSNIERCYQCGQCTAVCPMAEQEQAYKIRRFLQLEKIGKNSEGQMNIPFIFYCTTCYKCQDNCPQGVKIVDAVLAIREAAVHNGTMLQSHRKVAQMLIASGHAVPVNEEAKKRRLNLGLSELPPTVASSEKQLAEVKILLHLSGFDQLVAEKTEENLPTIKSMAFKTCNQVFAEGKA